MKTKLLILLILSFTIGLAVLTRFYKLGDAPAGLYIDEAGQGYSAYSILKTGKDEFGMPYPAVFRSFTDFKTPVYIYSIVPLIPIFDLTPFTVRLPSFIFSILTIPVLFLLIRKVAPPKISLPLSLLTVFLLAISPWHILFGRTNFECNLALFFFLAGVYVFYQSLKQPFLMVVAAVLFAIAIPAYHSQRLVTPIMILALFIRHKEAILGQGHKKWTIIATVVGLLLLLPTISIATTPGFLARASGLSILSSGTPAGFLQEYNGVFSWFVNGRWFLLVQEFFSLYLSYFSPRQMFNLGDYGPRSSFPELSTFFVWQMPFYLAGLYIFFKSKMSDLKFFTLVLLIVAPLPAALTRDPYSTIRALPLVVSQTIIIALGMLFLFQFAQKRAREFKLKVQFLALSAFLSLFVLVYSLGKIYSSAILLNEYFRANEWDWGWKQVVETIEDLDKNLPIVVDNSREEAYIELAFFLKYDPEAYQKENKEVELKNYYTDMNRNTLIKLGSITTRPINWEIDLKTKQYLIGDGLAISEQQIQRHNLKLVRQINYPNKSVAFRIVQTQPDE